MLASVSHVNVGLAYSVEHQFGGQKELKRAACHAPSIHGGKIDWCNGNLCRPSEKSLGLKGGGVAAPGQVFMTAELYTAKRVTLK